MDRSTLPRRCSEREPADSLRHKFNPSGGSLPSLTESLPQAMSAFKKAIIVGVLTAAVTWVAVYCTLHEPNPRKMPDGSLFYNVCSWSDKDDDLTALLWAAGAYALTFTPTFLMLRGGVPKDVFAHRQSIG